MAFEHTEGKGRIFKVKERKNEKSPHFTGSGMWKGEIISISGWANLGEDGKLQSVGLSIQEPREQSPQATTSNELDQW